MNPGTVRALLKARGLSRSELARRVGVTRQAVSLWARGPGDANVQGRHLLRVAEVLGVRPEALARPLPCLEPGEVERWRALYLWDRAYPDLDDFAIALARHEPRAVARLVEIHGLYGAERVLGRSVLDDFPGYRSFLPPVRREQLAGLHRWRSSRTAA